MKQGHIDVTTSTPAHLPGECQAVSSILSRIGDKWSVLIVMMLADGPKRFNQLRRMIGGVSQRMLTLTLRGLERDGLVSRTIHPMIPPRVDYELTPMGRTLLRTIEQLIDWADSHVAAIHVAQASYDAKHRPEDASPVDPEISACEEAERAARRGYSAPAG